MSPTLFNYYYYYSKLQTELFQPVGPRQCSAETWERLTQMRTFMPSLVLHACGRENTMPCQSAQTTEVASFILLESTLGEWRINI